MTRNRIVVVGLAALSVLGATAAPVAAKQQIGPRVKIDGAKLPEPDADTFATADDPAVGKTPPTLTGEGYSGQTVTVGPSTSPRMVIFLAHSCPHCQAEVPVIVELAEEGRLEGVEVDTITTNTNEDFDNYPPSKWLKREGWPFKPVLADDERLRSLIAFGGASFPYFVFVGADGTVAGRWAGELPGDELAEVARRLVAGESLFE
jgi:thiol-disulfide isomerase/thioredoxin